MQNSVDNIFVEAIGLNPIDLCSMIDDSLLDPNFVKLVDSAIKQKLPLVNSSRMTIVELGQLKKID